MSIRLMSAVWELDLPDSEKLVLLALADWAGDDGRCWPSVAQMAAKCSKGELTVQVTIKSLCAKGYVSRQDTIGKGTTYWVNPRSGCTPAAAAPPQPTTQTPAAAAPNTPVTINPQKAMPSSEARGRKASLPGCPDFIDPKAWADFLAVRKAKRAAPTEGALRRIIDKLERWRADGHDPNAILDTSITRNWTDVFEPKDQTHGSQPSRRIIPFEKPSGFDRWLSDEPLVGRGG